MLFFLVFCNSEVVFPVVHVNACYFGNFTLHACHAPAYVAPGPSMFSRHYTVYIYQNFDETRMQEARFARPIISAHLMSFKSFI